MTGAAAPPAVTRWQRIVLPAELHAGPSARRSPRDWVVDVLMLLFAVLVGGATFAETLSDHSPAAVVVDVVFGIVACGSLWWRRRHPAAVGVLTVVLASCSALAAGAALLALFNAAMRTSRRTLALIAALTLVAAAIFPLLLPGTDPYGVQLLVSVLVTGVAVGWGLFARARRELVQSLRERAERVEAEQRLGVEQAREAERRRIAREMHDVLAHRISLLSLHAGALEFRPDASPAEVAEAAGVIRASAHAALGELREVIGVLREDRLPGLATGLDGETGTRDAEPPQPTLAEIPALVEESRAAGMHVGCEIEIPAGATPPDALGRTAYRVVQEGLTNARKHAPGARVEVRLVHVPPALAGAGGTWLVVEVVNRRPLAPPADALPGAGSGLIGLAERVGLAGGELHHGWAPSGDFELRATLPWGDAAADALVPPGDVQAPSGAPRVLPAGARMPPAAPPSTEAPR